MYTLRNNYLTVEILDPLCDTNRLGSRYCTGGYIHQITDVQLGNLLSGPKYPDPDVDVFDGQGAPEVFVAAPNSSTAKIGDDILVIGVGLVTRTSPLEPFHARNNPLVRKFCTWQILHELPEFISMQTTQSLDIFEVTITRTIQLNNRTVTSATSLINCGDTSIPLIWFAHPFFPIPTDNLLHCFSNTLELPENSGYYIDDKGVIARKSNFDWKYGLYQLITLKNNGLLSAKQYHPLLDTLRVAGDFSPDARAIWGNDSTCSFEPFIKRLIEPKETCAWYITYSF